jgi:hypothetical protein
MKGIARPQREAGADGPPAVEYVADQVGARAELLGKVLLAVAPRE